MAVCDSEPRRLPGGLAFVVEGAVRMAPLLVLPRLLAERGFDPGLVIREGGSDLAAFDDPENTISFPAGGRLLAHAIAATGCPHLGLEIGRRNGLEVLGPLGNLARLAPDLGTALRVVILNLHLHDRGAVPALWERGDQAFLGYTIHWSDVPGTDHIYYLSLAVACNVLKDLAGPAWRPSEIWFHQDQPADIGPYRAHFRTRLRFAARLAAVVFPGADLTRPLPTADALAFAQALREVEALDALTGTQLADKVRRLLRRVLVAGASPDQVNLDRIAELFALHRRTLNRRLRDEGTTFRDLIAETRYEIARQLLRDTHLRIEEVARALGYAEATAFNRAFRGWSGTTPAAWRSAHQPR